MPFWGSMVGTSGEVTAPAIGAVIGTMTRWTLRREESGSGPLRPMTLRASFSFVQEFLLLEEALSKEVVIEVRKDKHFRVTGNRMAFVDQVLIMEDCSIESVE